MSDSGASASTIVSTIGSVLLLLAALSTGIIVWQVILQYRLLRLPIATGTMLRCDPVLSTTPDMPTSGNTPRAASMWIVQASYKYTVAGVPFEGHTFSQRTVGKISNRARWNDPPPQSIAALCARYSPGSTVDVRFHPENPRRSFIYFNPPWNEWGWALIPLITALAAGFFFFLAHLGRKTI